VLVQITVLAFYDRISLFQTLKPLLFYKDKSLFHFTQSIEYCLKEDKNDVLFMFRWFLKPDYVNFEQMEKLRQKYKRIFFFNGNAGGGIPRLELLDYVDYFFSKALFRDRSLYSKDFYGDELYNEYYHGIYPQVVYENEKKRAICNDPEKHKKLKLFWNIGIGDFPKKQFRQRAAVWAARKWGARSVVPFHLNRKPSLPDVKNKTLPVSARIRPFDDPFLNLHRQTYDKVIKNHSLFLHGPVPQNNYNREMEQASMVFSPFGWGELCFRDFEAVNQGALLLKPDVSHLETWPDVFIDKKCYVSLKWDGSDVAEKAEYYWHNKEERISIALCAYEKYQDDIQGIQQRLESILELI